MSHSPIREEKDCLNCGAIVQGRYCQDCGQENLIPKETFWHMVTHFFEDITHFDGSFFTTMKDLLFKPGFLTKEYMRGRRKAYLHPIRMYVFTSAVFFLVFFSMIKIKESDIEILKDGSKTEKVLNELESEALKKADSAKDSIAIEKTKEFFGIADSLGKQTQDSSGIVKGEMGSRKLSLDFGSAGKYSSVTEYDSIQNGLLKKDKDGFFMKILNKKLVGINEKYKGKESKLFSDIGNIFLHSFPYLLFVSLPLYALFLKLLYVRRKKFYYADHGVFLIHIYIFTFLFLLLFFVVNKLADSIQWGVFDFLKGILVLTGLFYTLKAMRNFYDQRWGKTILKFILFNFLCSVTAIILFSLFAMFSVFQI